MGISTQKVSNGVKENKQLDFLVESARAGKGAHAYLFAGAGSVDKKSVAVAFARELIGAGEASFNPDLMLVEVEEGERGISIDRIREIKKFLSFAPYAGENKVVIINEFERMKPEASSAILKILEEPPAKSVLILISDYPAMILPTILSRARKINFSGTGGQSLADIDKRKEVFYNLTELILANTAEKFNKIEDLSKKKNDSTDLFEYWLSFFRDLACLAAGCGEYVANDFYAKEMKELLARHPYSLAQISEIISEILRWSYVAKTSNTNKRLILENLVLLF